MTTEPASEKRSRRTQNERSEEMRNKLLDATIECLRRDGYAGTTVSRIIDVAGVSRGAPLHHFASKSALIAAAARRLTETIYYQLRSSIAHLDTSDDRLHDLIHTSWKEVFNRPEHVALNELLHASVHDPELAGIMKDLWTESYRTLRGAAEHYLEPLHPGDDVGKFMVLTQWMLRGMSLDLHLVENPAIYDHFLRLWSEMLAIRLRARGNTPPLPRRRKVSADDTGKPQA